jgi:hypothetical protein
VGTFAVTDDSDESEEDVVVVFEPDTDLLPDLLVDTENKMYIMKHTSLQTAIYCSNTTPHSNAF